MINKETKTQILILSISLIFIMILMWGIPVYSVWQQGQKGQAILAEAEYSRKVKIQEALATKESAQALAEAEVIRASGVSKANKIIGDSLKNNEAYLRYLYVNSLAEKDSNVYYIPTEAGLPILEAGRRNH
jgi:regulator of protease activity HflC (stomatin/prohibitin superfamily)